MSHGWIKDRFLREDVGRAVRYKETAGGVVRKWRLLSRDSSGDVVEASANAVDVEAIHVGDTASVASGSLASISLGGVVTGAPDVAVADDDLLKAYDAGKVGPLLTAALAGSDMSGGGQLGGGFTNQPSNDGVEVLSDDATDVNQTIVIYGTTTGTTTVVKEEVSLNGTTFVPTVKTDWGNILGVEIAGNTPVAAGTVTVREASGDATITTISAGSRLAGIYEVLLADRIGYNAIPDLVIDAANTDDVGLVCTDSAGAELLQAVTATGTTLVSFPSAARTVSKILLGDLASARTATVTVDANADDGSLAIGRARAAAAAGASAGVSFALEPNALSAGSVTQASLSSDVEATVLTTIATASVLTLNATPVELVPAPGAGKALIYLGSQWHLDFNSAAYAGIAAGEDLAIKYTDASGAQVAELETTGFLDATADEYRWAYPAGNTGAVLPSIEPVENAPLVAHMLVGEVTTGDSDLLVKVSYRVIDLALA